MTGKRFAIIVPFSGEFKVWIRARHGRGPGLAFICRFDMASENGQGEELHFKHPFLFYVKEETCLLAFTAGVPWPVA